MSDHRYEFIHKNHQRGHQCPGSFLHYSILTLKFLPGLALLLQIYPLQSWCIKIGKNFCAKGSLGAQWRAIHATGLLASPYTQWLACLSNQNAMCFQREFNRWAKRLAGDAAIKSSKLCDDTKIQRQKRCRNKKKSKGSGERKHQRAALSLFLQTFSTTPLFPLQITLMFGIPNGPLPLSPWEPTKRAIKQKENKTRTLFIYYLRTFVCY